MMRISFTHLAKCATRTVLLVSCLLICLACATPFPVEKLYEGMTTEVVREEFGAPEATEAGLGENAKSCWAYWHEEQEWFFLLPLFVPLWPFIILTNAALPDVPWDAAFVLRGPVLLVFEQEKLAWWETIEPVIGYISGSSYPHTKPGSGMPGMPDPGFPPISTTIPILRHFPDPPTCTSIWGLGWRSSPSGN